MNNPYGSSSAAKVLAEIIELRNNPLVTRRVGNLLADCTEGFKQLNGLELPWRSRFKDLWRIEMNTRINCSFAHDHELVCFLENVVRAHYKEAIKDDLAD